MRLRIVRIAIGAYCYLRRHVNAFQLSTKYRRDGYNGLISIDRTSHRSYVMAAAKVSFKCCRSPLLFQKIWQAIATIHFTAFQEAQPLGNIDEITGLDRLAHCCSKSISFQLAS